MSARTFIILAMVIVVSEIQAAAGLRGVVLSNELGGPPTANVEISAIAGILITRALTENSFSLFPIRNPGTRYDRS